MALSLSPQSVYPVAPPAAAPPKSVPASAAPAISKPAVPPREPAGLRSDRIAMLFWLVCAAVMASMLLKDLVAAVIFP